MEVTDKQDYQIYRKNRGQNKNKIVAQFFLYKIVYAVSKAFNIEN